MLAQYTGSIEKNLNHSKFSSRLSAWFTTTVTLLVLRKIYDTMTMSPGSINRLKMMTRVKKTWICCTKSTFHSVFRKYRITRCISRMTVPTCLRKHILLIKSEDSFRYSKRKDGKVMNFAGVKTGKKRMLFGVLLLMIVVSTKIKAASLKVVQVSAGGQHTAFLAEDGSLWMCGNNKYGQLGDGKQEDYVLLPKEIMKGVKAVSAGFEHTAIIKQDGSLWIWGETGIDNYKISPKNPYMLMSNVKAVSAGDRSTAIIKEDDSLWMCGDNQTGKLGNGSKAFNVNKPVKIMTEVQSVSSNYNHTAILKKDGSLWMCGWNYDREYGDGTTNCSEKPVKIMSGVKAVSTGMNYSVILKNDGSVWTCGDNYYGQLGNGTYIGTGDDKHLDRIMTDVKEISAFYTHTAILKEDGSLWMCGRNNVGQLGKGTQKFKVRPTKIMSGVQAVDTGGSHTVILKEDGSVWMCGYNKYGQLGDGTTKNRTTPVQILLLHDLKQENAVVSRIAAQAYTGSEIKPAVTVKAGGKSLKEGTDYTVSYANNKKIGTATVTIKGEGEYTGTLTTSFTIRTPIGMRLQHTGSNGIYIVKKTGTGGTAEVQFVKPIEAAEKAVIPSTITVGGCIFKVTSIGRSAFYGDTALKSVKIGKNIHTIYTCAFFGCRSLCTVSMTRGLNAIGSGAFTGCTSLTSIVIPSTVTKIKRRVFYGCSSLREIQLNTKELDASTIGAQAFTGIHRSAIISVPASKVEAYREILLHRGVKAGMKVQRK